MRATTADLHAAIVEAWDAAGLDALFKALWPDSVEATDFPALHDQEATPGQPFPFCVLSETRGRTVARMSGGVDSLQEVRDVSVAFNIHARRMAGDARSAKELAADLAEQVMMVFGGHPSVSPTARLELVNGNHLLTQYQTDYCVRVGQDGYQWVIEYVFRIDVPVAT